MAFATVADITRRQLRVHLDAIELHARQGSPWAMGEIITRLELIRRLIEESEE
jgi:hypothetical protein